MGIVEKECDPLELFRVEGTRGLVFESEDISQRVKFTSLLALPQLEVDAVVVLGQRAGLEFSAVAENGA